VNSSFSARPGIGQRVEQAVQGEAEHGGAVGAYAVLHQRADLPFGERQQPGEAHHAAEEQQYLGAGGPGEEQQVQVVFDEFLHQAIPFKASSGESSRSEVPL
jgi:hypothetical protein